MEEDTTVDDKNESDDDHSFSKIVDDDAKEAVDISSDFSNDNKPSQSCVLGADVGGSGDIQENQLIHNVPSASKISQDDNLQALCNDMFSKIGLYLESEVKSTVEDYKLLEQMNEAATTKYDQMLELAKTSSDNLRNLNQKFVELQPYFDEIETIEKNVLLLEQTAYKLDVYSKRLEERFKKLDKK